MCGVCLLAWELQMEKQCVRNERGVEFTSKDQSTGLQSPGLG